MKFHQLYSGSPAYHSWKFLGLVVIVSVYIVLSRLRHRRSLRASPKEPPNLPYWVPGLGNAVAFLWDYNVFLSRAANFFSELNPYTISLGGWKFYIINDPWDVVALYRHPASTTFDGFVEHLMRRGFGIPATTMDIMKTKPEPGPKSLLLSSHNFYLQRLQPGPETDYTVCGKQVHQYMREYWRRCREGYSLPFGSRNIKTPSSEPVELYAWCRTVCVACVSDSFYNPYLMQNFPDLPDTFGTFDLGSWKLFYSFPRALAPFTHAARESMIDAIEAMLENVKSSDMSRLAGQMANDLEAGGVTKRHVAAFTAMIFWAMNGNIYKVAFWMLIYITQTPGLKDTLRSKARVATDGTNLIHDPAILLDPTQCPIFDAVWKETLRVCSASNSIRLITTDFSIGPYRFEKGASLLAPSQNTHFMPEIWGPNANEFDYRRFLANPKLARHPGYRPFGGGTSYCPGRHFAKSEIAQFVIGALQTYDIELEPRGLDLTSVGRLQVGAKDPANPESVRVKLSLRKS